MRRQPIVILFVLSLTAGAIFLLTTRFLFAQESTGDSQTSPNGPEITVVNSSVASKFTYQGLLEEDGSLVTGTRDMSFQLHSVAGCTTALGSSASLPDVPVDEGLFSVEVPVDPTYIDGQARWLELSVAGVPIGCQELLPVPYALSLRPGALISGSVGIEVGATDVDSIGVTGTGDAVGLFGASRAVAGSPVGVWGEVDAADGYGGYFNNESNSPDGPDVVLGGNAEVLNDEGNLWSDPTQVSSDIYLRSNDEIWLDLDQNNDEDAGFRVRNGANTTVFSVDESGNTYSAGTKSAVVEAAPDEHYAVYAVESPVVVFEDFGSARLEDGVATVEIDPLFAQTVNLEVDYQLFITPVDGWAALYVTNKTSTSFEVRDAEGSASIAFDYRIVARRRGYEDVRLEPVESADAPVNEEADD